MTTITGKRIRIRGLVSIVALALTSNVFAQNDILLTQQMISRININPAATGNSDYLNAFVLMRQQWAGFENAPETGVINFHGYFDRIRSGLGLTATYDKIGVGNTSVNAKLAYAYHFNLGENWLMSLGLSGGVKQNAFDPTKQFFIDETDPEIPMEKISQLSPDVDFGFEISSERFLLGASATHLLKLPDQASSAYDAHQYYAYMRYKQPVGESVALYAGVRGSNFDTKYFLEGNLTAMFFDIFWIGGAFRPDNAAAGFAGVQFEFFKLGYAYDYSIGKTASLAKSSHEIVVSIRLAKLKKSVNTKSPRFIEN